MFLEHSLGGDPMENRMKLFREKYVDEDNYQQTIHHLDACRETLLHSFTTRFSGLNYDILWIGYLDPCQRDMLH